MTQDVKIGGGCCRKLFGIKTGFPDEVGGDLEWGADLGWMVVKLVDIVFFLVRKSMGWFAASLLKIENIHNYFGSQLTF